jgi:hypothetical protein
MADIRTLKLALLADTKNFIDGLDKADKETRTFTNKLDDALKAGAAAFLAVGAAAATMAIKIGVDAVKAAIEDEKAQATLAKTLENTTKATKDQIKSVEDYIDKTARATGVTDDQLRPSLDRLLRSTKDVTKAQSLQQLALDISAGTGKDLATITEGLSKAFDGNLGALKRLGVPLSESIIKSKDFDAAVKELSKTFEGQADVAANTFEGRMKRVRVAIDEAKEQLGASLLPVLEKFAKVITDTILPVVQSLVDGLTGAGTGSLRRAFYDTGTGTITFRDDLNNAKGSAYLLGEEIRIVAGKVGLFVDQLSGAANDQGLKAFLDKILEIINAIETAIGAYNRLPDIGKLLVNPAPQLASLTPAVKQATGSVVNIYNNVKGAIDPQSTARAITKVQNTAAQTTGLKPFFYGFR